MIKTLCRFAHSSFFHLFSDAVSLLCIRHILKGSVPEHVCDDIKTVTFSVPLHRKFAFNYFHLQFLNIQFSAIMGVISVSAF